MMRITERRVPEHRRIRKSSQKQSASYLSLAAFTIAGVYMMFPTKAFTPSATRPSIHKAIAGDSASPFRLQPLTRVGPDARHPSLTPKTRLYSSKGDESDRQEWRALLAALQMYKAAYGDLKVPMRFVVPSMPPWPEAAWELKLGQTVGAIRGTGKYVGNNERRRKQLDKLGFIWRAREPTRSARDSSEVPFEQVYQALQVYRQEVHPMGPFSVPLQYTVPDSEPWPVETRGMPLGRSTRKVTTTKFLKENPEIEQKLNDLGYQLGAGMSANDVRFQNVFTALERYKEIYGDLLIPQPFEVPDKTSDWPEPTWGLRLGARVNAIRSQGTFVKNDPERKAMLDDLGFVWAPPESERRKRGRKSKAEKELEEQEALLEAPKAEVDTEGEIQADSQDVDSLVSSFDFSVTDSDGAESSTPTWGFEGGQAMQAAVAAQQEAAEQAAADEYKPPMSLGESLANARERAIEVGIIEGGEGKTMRKGKREKEIPWFNDDFGGFFVFEDVVEALTLYKKFYGNFANLTNEDFVIPAQGDALSQFEEDEDADDMNMMESDPSRSAAAIARFKEFDDLSMTEDMMDDEISSLEKVLSPDAESELVATAVVEPQMEVDWPDHLGGMRLGNIVTRIRDGSLEVKHLPDRKEQLDAIDFDWGDPKYFIDVPFEKAMCGMYAYYLVRGDMFVPADFEMPDEDPWPKALAGYELGLAVKRIRELQNFLEAYHTEKVGLLRMVDFVWFPTLALPLDPNESEVTPEMLKLGAMGHPDYAKLSDIPMGLPEKIIADGPYFETDDPKLWWRKWHNWDHVEDIWYENGRRDNAFVLRGLGYPQMAAEHEEKYGPGLFAQIEDSMGILRSGKKMDADERENMLETLLYYRKELNGCEDLRPEVLKGLVEEIEDRILELDPETEEGESGENHVDSGLSMQYEEEAVDLEYEEGESEAANTDDYEYEYEYVEEEYEEDSSEAKS